MKPFSPRFRSKHLCQLATPQLLRRVLFGVLTTGLWGTSLLAEELSPSRCLTQPEHLELRLAGGEFECDPRPKDWSRGPAGSFELFVHADGPSGSGRFWNVTIGVAEREDTEPVRGLCLTTSTVGWRTLKGYKTPLPWLDDLENDGHSELVIWDSFPLRDGASLAEHGLAAWVYRLVSEDTLRIDWRLSRQMARELAHAYRSPSTAALPGPLQKAAANALEQFADEQCEMAQSRSSLIGRGDDRRYADFAEVDFANSFYVFAVDGPPEEILLKDGRYDAPQTEGLGFMSARLISKHVCEPDQPARPIALGHVRFRWGGGSSNCVNSAYLFALMASA